MIRAGAAADWWIRFLSIDHELEDAIIGDEMYYRLLNHFEQALEMKHY